MLEACERENVYIIEKIIKDLDKFVLFLTVRHDFASLINIDIIFLNVNNVFKFTLINLKNVDINSTNIANK